jgi:hypothetical protein
MWMSMSDPTTVEFSACTTFGRSRGDQVPLEGNGVVVGAGTGLHESNSGLWRWIILKVPVADRLIIGAVCQDIRELSSGFSSFCVEWTEIPILSGCWWLFMMQPNPEFKESFLTEFVQSCIDESLHLCIGGFQYNPKQQRKNNDRFDEKWSLLFNVVVNSLNLRGIEMSGRKFT